MDHPIEERTAWRLVLAVSPEPKEPAIVSAEAPGPGGARQPARLLVDSSGRWEAVTPVSREAREIFDLYLPLRVGRSWTIGQLGQSLDGRIATEAGHSHYITGPQDRRRLHRMRALADAVVVGSGTVAADNPRLTVREAEGENPVRVILDPDGRLDAGRRVFTDGAAPTLVVRRWKSAAAPTPGTTEVLNLRGAGSFDPEDVVVALRRRGLTRILVEGGGVTVSRFLVAGALDRLHVTVAPLLIGPGRPAFHLEPVETLDRALRPPCRRFHLGEDILFDLDLRAAHSRSGSIDPHPSGGE